MLCEVYDISTSAIDGRFVTFGDREVWLVPTHPRTSYQTPHIQPSTAIVTLPYPYSLVQFAVVEPIRDILSVVVPHKFYFLICKY